MTGGWIPHLDANWVDAGTLIVAIAYGLIRHFRAVPKKPFLDKQTRKDFLDGTAFFPLGVLTLSCFSTDLTKALLEANKLILSVAGIVAILAILED